MVPTMTHFTFNRHLYVYMPLGINMDKETLTKLNNALNIINTIRFEGVEEEYLDRMLAQVGYNIKGAMLVEVKE